MYLQMSGCEPKAVQLAHCFLSPWACTRDRQKTGMYSPPGPSCSVVTAQVRRDFGDLPLLKSITGALGPAMWFNAIVVLTHAASAPPDNASGPMSYEMYASNRTHLLQQSIRRAPNPPSPPSPSLPLPSPPPTPGGCIYCVLFFLTA